MNFIVIVLDAVRSDHLGCYGYPRKTSPNIDEFASKNITFTNAYSTATATPLAHYSLFTGTSQDFERHKDSESSIIRILNDNGYYTLGVSANSIVSPSSMGVAEGFHDFGEVDYSMLEDEVSSSTELTQEEKDILGMYSAKSTQFNRYSILTSAEKINDVIFKKLSVYLNNHTEKPLFLFVNYFDAHDPYFPREPYRTQLDSDVRSSFNGDIRNRDVERFKGGRLSIELGSKVIHPWMINFELGQEDLRRLSDLYDGEIAYVDHYFGELQKELKRLKLYKNSAIFLLADHGELLGEHNLLTHSLDSYEELVRIPMIVRITKLRPKKAKIADRVMITDVKPTILELLGIAKTNPAEGTSLLTLMRQGADIANPILKARRNEEFSKPPENVSEFSRKQLLPGQDQREELKRRLRALGYLK